MIRQCSVRKESLLLEQLDEVFHSVREEMESSAHKQLLLEEVRYMDKYCIDAGANMAEKISEFEKNVNEYNEKLKKLIDERLKLIRQYYEYNGNSNLKDNIIKLSNEIDNVQNQIELAQINLEGARRLTRGDDSRPLKNRQ